MQRVRAELGAIVKADAATWQPAAALCDLATIDAFQLFLTTGLDPAPRNRAARRSWRGARRLGIHGRTRKRKTCRRGGGGAPVTVYHLFGTASRPGTNFAVTEEDTLEGLLALRQYSPNLSAAHGRSHEESPAAAGLPVSRLARAHVPAHRARQAARRARATRRNSSAIREPGTPLVLFLERFSAGSRGAAGDGGAIDRRAGGGVAGQPPRADGGRSGRAAAVHLCELRQRGRQRPPARSATRCASAGSTSGSTRARRPMPSSPESPSIDAFASRSPGANCLCRCCRAAPRDGWKATSARSGDSPCSARRASPRTSRSWCRCASMTCRMANRASRRPCARNTGSRCPAARLTKASSSTSCRLSAPCVRAVRGGGG